jgi:hypothetical protein
MQCHADAIGMTTESRSDCRAASQRLNSRRLKPSSLRVQPRPRVASSPNTYESSTASTYPTTAYIFDSTSGLQRGTSASCGLKPRREIFCMQRVLSAPQFATARMKRS